MRPTKALKATNYCCHTSKSTHIPIRFHTACTPLSLSKIVPTSPRCSQGTPSHPIPRGKFRPNGLIYRSIWGLNFTRHLRWLARTPPPSRSPHIKTSTHLRRLPHVSHLPHHRNLRTSPTSYPRLPLAAHRNLRTSSFAHQNHLTLLTSGIVTTPNTDSTPIYPP